MCCSGVRCSGASNRTRCSRRRCCCCRSAFRRSPRSIRTPPSCPRYAAFPAARKRRYASSSIPTTPIPEVQLLSNGRYHVMVTNAGGGEHPLEGSRRHPLARGQHLRQLGHVLLHPRHGERGLLVDGASADASSARRTTRRYSPKHARNFAVATRISNRMSKSSFRRKTTSSCGGCASRTAHGRGARSMSRAMRRWPSRRRPRTHCIRRFPTSSCRPRSSASGKPSCARDGRARGTSRHRGCSTSWPSTGRASSDVSYETDRAAFIGRGRTVAAPRAMLERGTALRTARDRCSIRSSRSGIG